MRKVDKWVSMFMLLCDVENEGESISVRKYAVNGL